MSDCALCSGRFVLRQKVQVKFCKKTTSFFLKKYLFISVIEMLNSDSHFMSYGLWVTTIGCVCMAILFAVFSAVFAGN
jgi:hypothetical protein